MTLVVINTRRNRGFTLIEVIVALGIIATAMAAVMMTVSANVRTATGLHERTLAHWVAKKKMAELHLVNYKEWPSIKKTTGTALMAEHEWYWEQEVEKTPVDKIRKVYIRVRSDEDDEYPIITLVGFVQQPSS